LWNPQVVAQTASKDPEVGLRGVASLRALLTRLKSFRSGARASSAGAGSRSPRCFGVSKQAVHQKYGKGERRLRRSLR
jgi:hypothetical protein